MRSFVASMLRKEMSICFILWSMVSGFALGQSDVNNIGIRFTNEPPNRVEFANIKGVNLTCAAKGVSTPVTNWTLTDGTRVTEVPGLREIGRTGELMFLPFGADKYRPDVHAAVYRCTASSIVGILHSRDVNVYGVVIQSYDAQVYDAYVMEGNTAVLKCHVPAVVGDFLTVVAWIKNEKLHILPPVSGKDFDEKKYAVLPSGDLHIKNVSITESNSKYKCKTRHDLTGDEQISTTAGSLFVTEKCNVEVFLADTVELPSQGVSVSRLENEPRGNMQPRILEGSTRIDATINSTAALACLSQGNPSPTLSWFRKDGQGNLISISSGTDFVVDDSFLRIRNVRSDHDGVYVCEARNAIEKDRLEIMVFVNKPISVSIRPVLATTKVGNNITFLCESFSPTPLSLSWLHDGVVVKGASGSELNLGPVKISDQGVYQCMARGDKTMAQSAAELRLTEIQPHIQETFDETVIQLGAPLTLRCSALGIPRPTFRWTLDEASVSTNGSRIRTTTRLARNGTVMSILHIGKVSSSDGGTYGCVASNDGGRSKHVARVSIPGQLTGREIKKLPAVSGNDVYLNCPYYGHPVTEISWSKDGKNNLLVSRNVRLRQFTNGTLLIKDAHSDDNGLYQCAVRNSLGQKASGRIVVQVIVPPKIVPFEFQDELLREGMRARLQCVISEGDLPLNVTWLKDGKPIASELGIMVQALDEYSSILTLSSITPAHNGKFTCLASNLAATVTHTAELSVNVLPKIVPFSFGDSLHEGSPARVVCGLQEGDPPVRFSWLHNGVPMKEEHVHNVDGMSSILSFGQLRVEHSGIYKCTIENIAGASQHETMLLVNVPPKIVPFFFQEEHLVEGQLARVSCIISRGDLPLKLHWERDGVEIVPRSEGIQIHSLDEHSSILSISSVSMKLNGVYTCVAANSVGLARHSAKLVANVPPKWTTEPQDVSAVVGVPTSLHCMASGYPEPTISWSFAKTMETLVSDPTSVRDGPQSTVAPNGSLIFNPLNSASEGYYMCTASNGIGRNLNAVVQVKINAPPKFKKPLTNIRISLKKNVQLQCEVEGNRPLNVSWWVNGRPIQLVGPRVTEEVVNLTNNVLSTLTIHNLLRNDTAVYSCNASNAYGANFTSSQLIVQEAPDAPSELSAAARGSTTIELAWKPSYDGHDPIKKYIVQYKAESGSWDMAVAMETVNGMPTNSIIGQLIPATTYLFRVFGENAQGRSTSSKILTATTEEDVPSGVPVDVQVESVNAETFRVTWKAPEPNTWNGNLIGFYVGYKEVNVDDALAFKSLLIPSVPRAEEVLAVEIGELRQFTKYAVMVQMYNSRGKGPLSDAVVAMTSEGVPSQPPTNARCTTLTSHSLHITWTAPSPDSINGILRGYKVSYRPASQLFDDMADSFNVTLPTSLTLTQMNKFTNYSIQVLAMTKVGEGPSSTAIFCKTLDDAPEAPSDIKAASLSADSIIISWKPPHNPNGILKSYSVYWKDSEKDKGVSVNSAPALSSSYEILGLKENGQYDFWVTASTVAGEGPASRVVRQSPIGPKVPARIISFDEKIITAWQSDVSFPCQTVGNPKPLIKWIHGDTAIEMNERVSVGLDGMLSVKSVLESDAGDYSCIATNEVNEDRISYTIIVLAPPHAPVTEVVFTSASSIHILWQPPKSNKLSKIKGYTVHSRKEGGEWQELTLGADAVAHQLENLDCGTRYECYVTPFNKIGIGAPSEILVASTNGSVPAAPSKEDLVEEASTSISLYLNTWKSNGCPVLHFSVEYSPRSVNEWSLVSDNVRPEQRRLVVPGLRPATWYGLRMTASNGAGSTIAEYTFATLTSAGATVSPDLQSDAAVHEVEGLLAYLNFYLVVPVICMMVVLLAVLGAACFYVKVKKREQQSDRANRASTVSASLMHGTRSGSFSYVQRATLGRGPNHSRLQEDELSPYATFHLTNHGSDTMRRHSNVAPPLPPPRMFDRFPQEPSLPMNPNYSSAVSGFIPGPVETTFIFPRLPAEDLSLQQCPLNFPRSYPVHELNSKFT